MMIKAIFFDLDGTLLDSNKNILESSVEYLKKCKEKNIKLFILLRQEDSDLYRSGMNCRQPVRAENCLTSQKCNDTI